MPKLNFNSRNNRLTAVGLIDYIEDRIDQYVLMTSDVEFNSIDVTTNALIGGNLNVVGNLTVSGSSTVISTQVVELEDNIILVNSGETSATGVSLNLAGVEISRGALANFQAVFEESSGLYKIGEVGHLQAVATREDNPLDKGISVFNAAQRRLDSTDNVAIPITFSGNTESVSSSTGTIKVVGGIGATGNISLEKAVKFLGSNYSSEIKSNVSNDLVLSPGNHIDLITPVVKIQDTSVVQFGSPTQTISNLGDNVVISASSGDISLATELSGKVVLPEQTYIRWGTSFNDISFDGADINLRSTGKFNIFANVTLGTLDPSISPVTGSLVLNGGLGISGTQDSVSSDNGGSLTIAGGAAIKKALRIGSSIDIGDTSTTINPGANLGINFRSRSKTLTTADTNNLTFNSFEGGTVSGAGPIPEASTVLITSSPIGINVTNKFALQVASGVSKFGDIVLAASSVVSGSPSSGALVVSGGIGITNTTDSVSSANGGSFTTAGGLSVAKSVKVGDSFRVGETNSNTIQQIDSGLNFRSLSRVITTPSILNATFNSFEGGVLDTTGTIPESSTVLIKAAPIASGGGTIQTPLALSVQSGNCKFAGNTLTEGTVRITDTTDSSLVSLGGMSISKNLLVGNNIKTYNGTNTPHLSLSNTSQNSRFSINLKDLESGGNSGSNFEVVRYSDAGSAVSTLEINRNNSNIIFKSTTDSTAANVGGVVTNGGLGINCATDATSSSAGGSLTTSGGVGISKKLFVGGNTTLSGGLTSTSPSILSKVSIDTTSGSFDISGTGGMNAVLAASSTLSTSSGTLTLSSTSGAIAMSSSTSTGISAGSNLAISSGGTTSVSSLSNSISSSTGSNTFSSFGSTLISAGTGGINANTTDTTQGIKIGTVNPGVPLTLGNAFSETRVNGNFTVGGNFNVLGTLTTIDSTIVTVNDNAFVVNAAPSGISDGGFLMRRYQPPTDSNMGQVILDTPKETSAFQSGSTLSSLVLNSSANSGINYYRGWWLKITSGPASGSTRRIKEYNGTTKVATIFTTLDNNEYNDGLDLATAPISGNTYQLFDIPYAGIYFSESAQEVVISGVSFDQTSGTFGTPTSYLPLHVQTLITETGLTLGGNISVKNDDLEVFNIKNNSNQTILNTDSINGIFTLALPISTVNSGPTILLSGKDSVSGDVVYSSIKSVINNNVSGALDSSLVIRGQTGTSGLIDILRLNGISTILSSKLTCQDTTPSTSITSGSVVTTGGISVNCATDATSENNGGSLTIAGGLAAKKKVFIGGETVFTKGKVVGATSNNLLAESATLNADGDLGLYGTSGKLFFGENIPTGIPTFNSRSVGTKIVLFPGITSITTDTAIGNSSTGPWISAPDSSKDISFYLGTNLISSFGSTGLNLPVVETGINLNGAILKSSSGSKTVFSPASNTAGIIFTDSTSSTDLVRINGLGQIKAGISASTITSATEGALLDISNTGIFDNITANSGTISGVAAVRVKQNTLSATSSGVTTSVAASMLVSGAMKVGTNETFASSSGIYIDSAESINTGLSIVPLASSLFIKNSPSGNNVTKSRALFVESGIVEAGDVAIFTKGKVVGATSNTLGEETTTLNVDGDLGLYGTSGKLFFNPGSPPGIPVFNSRSVGTKVVLSPAITASSTDTALGTSSTGPWISAPNASSDISFYLGTLCKVKVTGNGMVVDSGTPSTLFEISCPDNTTGIKLDGGLSSLELFGNGDCAINTDFVVSSTGQLLVSNTAESSSSSSSSSIKTLGGLSVAKTISCGTSLNLDFNQPYVLSGESSGSLNIQSKVSSTNNNVKLFTNDGDSTDNNTLSIYSSGTPSSQANTEFLTTGFVVSEGFTIKTARTGTGITTPLLLKSGDNTGQLNLETDGSVSMTGNLRITNTTDANSATVGGTFTTSGGLAVAKKLFVGTDLSVGGNLVISGNLDTGITSPTISIFNATVATTQVRSSLSRNGTTRTLVANFTLTPVSQGTNHIFDISLPGVSTNLVNSFDITSFASGYTSSFTNIENVFVRGVSGTTTARVSFTSASLSPMVIQISVSYTV